MGKGTKEKMPLGLTHVLMDQRAAFVKKFGREPGPRDPVLFDPDKDVPTPLPPERMKASLREALLRAGFDEAEVDAGLEEMRRSAMAEEARHEH